MSYYRKPKIPYEIRNAREWEPNRQPHSQSNDDEDDEDDEDTQVDDGTVIATSIIQQNASAPPANDIDKDDEGFQPVVRRFTKHIAKIERERAERLSSTPAHKSSPPVTAKAPATVSVKTQQVFNAKAPRLDNIKAQTAADRTKPPPKANSKAQPATNKNAPVVAVVNAQSKVSTRALSYANFMAGRATNAGQSKNFQSQSSYKIKPQPSALLESQLSEIQKALPVRKDAATMTPKTTAPGVNSMASKPLLDKPHRSAQKFFNFEKDNAAKVAFRQRREAPGSFELHKDIIEIELDASRVQKVLHDIGVRCDSFIRPPQTANDRKLLIWGSEKQITKTKSELRLWIQKLEKAEGSKSAAKEKFAKADSVIGPNYKAYRKQTALKAALARFQQNPDPDETFEYGGVYRWPNEDFGPQELFGLNLEAFDGVKYALKCHIVFDERLRMIRVYSNTGGAVAKSLKLVEGALTEFHARGALDGQPKSLILVDVSQCSNNSMVILQQCRSGSNTFHVPVLENGLSDEALDTDWKNQAYNITVSHTVRLQRTLEFAMHHLKHFRGHIRVKLHIGTFALKKFRWPTEKSLTSSIALEVFLANVEQSGTSGILLRSLYTQPQALEVLKMIRQAEDLFEPLEWSGESLSGAAPAYGAQFVIHRFEKSSLLLEVEFINRGLTYSKSQSLWSNHDQKASNPPLSIFTVRLGGSLSWKFQISKENNFDKSRIDEAMEEFEESVKLDETVSREDAETHGQKLIKWKPGPFKPSIFEQKTAFRYRLKQMPDIIFELSRYDSYNLSTNAQTPSATSWGASLWHTECNMALSGNANLGLGEHAAWKPSLDTFFPDYQPNSTKSSSQPQGMHLGLSLFLGSIQPVMKRLDDYGKGAL